MKRHLFLITLLLVALVSPVFAATVSTTVEFGQVAQYTEQSYDNAGVMANGEARTLVIYSGGTNTSTKLTAADDGYNSTSGASKFSNTSVFGANLKKLDPSSRQKSHVRFSAIAGEQVRFYYFSSSVLGQVHTFYLSHTTTESDQSVVGNATCATGDKVLYYVDFNIPTDGEYYISVNGGQKEDLSGGTQISVSGIKFTNLPYQILADYTWTSKTFGTAELNSEFDMTETGTLRAGTAIKGVSGDTEALKRTSINNVNMLSLVKKNNYIELTATEALQAYDEIEIVGYAAGVDERGLYIEPNTKSEYFTTSTTALATSKFSGQVLHTSYTATVTEEWLAASGATNTIRIFCNGKNIAVEKISIIRHAAELTEQTVVSGTINGATTDMTAERIEKLNTGSHTFSMSGAYHATIVLNVRQTYELDGDPANTRVINKEITLTEGEIAADGGTPYTATVGEITYKVTLKPYTASNVTSGKTWTWGQFTATTAEMTDETFPKKNTDVVMANVIGKENGSQYLTIAGQFAVTEKNNGSSSDKVKCFVGNSIKFNTTVPGIVRATWVSNGTSERVLTINGIATAVSSSATTDAYITTEDIYVEAGEVVIQCALTDGTSSKQYFRLTELKFQTTDTPEAVRTGLTVGKFGTICLAKDAYNATGATFYDLEYTDGSSITLIEHIGVLKAGMPYVFEAEDTEITVAYKSMDPVAAGKNHNGLYGTLEPMAAGSLTDKYVISNNEVRLCSSNATLGANRAYIDLTKVPTMQSSAPGRRRVLGAPQVATSVENAASEMSVRKVVKDGQVLIIRQGRMYSADGRIVNK